MELYEKLNEILRKKLNIPENNKQDHNNQMEIIEENGKRVKAKK